MTGAPGVPHADRTPVTSHEETPCPSRRSGRAIGAVRSCMRTASTSTTSRSGRASRSCCCTAVSCRRARCGATTPSRMPTTWRRSDSTSESSLPTLVVPASREPGDGTASFAVLAEDVRALIDALGLDRPMVGGFSEGGITATVLGLTHPEFGASDRERRRLRHVQPRVALVHDDEDDARRQPRRDSGRSRCGRTLLLRLARDEAHARGDEGRPRRAQGEGYWRTYITNAFPRTTQPLGYTFDDLAKVTAPTLVLVGRQRRVLLGRGGCRHLPQAAERGARDLARHRAPPHPRQDRDDDRFPRAAPTPEPNAELRSVELCGRSCGPPVLLVAALCVSCRPTLRAAPRDSAVAVGHSQRTVTVGGTERTVLLYRPDGTAHERRSS